MSEFNTTFNNAAAAYEKSRPLYVKELYEDIWRYYPLGEDSKVLEIGMGTGKATEPFLQTGCSLVGIEPGENLLELAGKNLADYEKVTFFNGTLQDYTCEPENFDLIYAATAFHWIPEEYGYPRVFELLKKGGTFARFAYHAGPDYSRPGLHADIQALYQKYMGKGESPKAFDIEAAGKLAETAVKYGFEGIKYSIYHMDKDFTAEEYMELLRTYPDHMALEEERRQALFAGIYEAIERHGGTITVHYIMDLELARKK